MAVVIGHQPSHAQPGCARNAADDADDTGVARMGAVDSAERLTATLSGLMWSAAWM